MVLGEFKVREVQEGNRLWWEPEFDREWSDLTKLRWEAAVAEAESGERLRVHVGGFFIAGVMQLGYYSLSGLGWGLGPVTYEAARDYIHGFALGARQANRRKVPREDTPIFAAVVTRYMLAGASIAREIE